MLPTKQTVIHDPDNGKIGNCLSATLASLLHLPIENVPLFVSDTWVSDLNNWLRPYGLAYYMIADFNTGIAEYGISGVWHEIAGNTKRSADVLHACVGKDAGVVFDPHPDNSGLTNVVSSGVFICLEPWRWIQKNMEK